MACPKVLLRGRTIILLSGFRNRPSARGKLASKLLKIDALKQLRQSASRNPDAIAFGYVAGKWLPAA
jgi:hypothetical protein